MVRDVISGATVRGYLRTRTFDVELSFPGIKVNPASVKSFSRILQRSSVDAPIQFSTCKLAAGNFLTRAVIKGGKIRKNVDSHFSIRPMLLIANLYFPNLLLFTFPSTDLNHLFRNPGLFLFELFTDLGILMLDLFNFCSVVFRGRLV